MLHSGSSIGQFAITPKARELLMEAAGFYLFGNSAQFHSLRSADSTLSPVSSSLVTAGIHTSVSSVLLVSVNVYMK